MPSIAPPEPSLVEPADTSTTPAQTPLVEPADLSTTPAQTPLVEPADTSTTPAQTPLVEPADLSTTTSPTPLVELRDVSVSFGATRALDHVSFRVLPGEIHVLAGENGAGKSTLIRILSGVITHFTGTMLVAGRPTRLRDARDAARHGIATIHQELSLVGSMTVADNLALVRPAPLFAWIRPAADTRAARALLREMDLDLDPEALVETLPLATRQLLEIARALAQNARLLILDEPTSALEEPEADRLLTRLEHLARAGCGILYISHRMQENDRLAHHITVLRDGRLLASRPARDLPRDQLVTLMMGAERTPQPDPAPDHSVPSRAPPALASSSHLPSSQAPTALPSSSHAPSSQASSSPVGATHSRSSTSSLETLPLASSIDLPLLDVRDLHAAPPGASPLHGVSFSVARGEILGLAGLRGSGASETLAALFGATGKPLRALVQLDGAPFVIESPARSIAQGLLFLANDRKKSVLHDLDITENITLSSLAPHGIPARAREAQLARDLTTRLRVATPSLRTPAGALSGGNQQKVALLRCLAAEPRVLLLDEPTRGVDVGAKADIHHTLRARAARGTAIVLVASELQELTTLCDRVAVLWRGRITATLTRPDLTEQRLRLALDGPATERPTPHQR